MAHMLKAPPTLLRVQPTDVTGGDQIVLARPAIAIGRATDNDIILEDPRVSRHHLRLQFAQGVWTVTDVGSSRGSRINNAPLAPGFPKPLNPGDQISIDGFNLTIARADPNSTPAEGRLRLSAQPHPTLVTQDLSGASRNIPLDKPVLTVGRAADNDIVIDNPQVSRHHARITVSDGQVAIEDLGSTNGIVVEGQRVQTHVFTPQDSINLGAGGPLLRFSSGIGFVSADDLPLPPSTTGQTSTGAQRLALQTQGMETISIGRAPGNDIVLNHPMVSRHHALLERMGGRYRIKDLKSQNGVFVDGKKVDREAWVHEGSSVTIAGIELALRADGIDQFSHEGLRLDAIQLNKWVTKDKNLLQDISLSIYPQEFVALVGMSGSGKSTLLDSLNGFRPATHGRVSLNGTDLYHNFDQFRNEMGYVPQKDVVHQELTVYGALNYAAQLRMPADTTAAERHQRIVEVLHDLDLTERKDLPIHKLSGGQLKRVSIGVELLTKPRLFFLDEPTSGLDPGTEFEMMRLLRKLADQGRTIVLITHATKNVMMCDKVIFLARGGYVAFYGPPEEALPYFDAYRTEHERQLKDMEFDDIYVILNDEKRGTGKDWGSRYRSSQQYREYVVKRLQTLQQQGAMPQAGPAERASQRVATRPKTGTMRQMMILSARNLKIMFQDKFGLALMLALAPIIGVMDFMWGNSLFDLKDGDAVKVITMVFMAGLISFLTGAMASVREIVKEIDIYKRERAVNLSLTAYILSKIWVGVVLSLYQAVVLFLFAYVLNLSGASLSAGTLVAILVTLFISTVSGYLTGLCISAFAPNQNVALLLVIVVLVPQFLFAGALLPLDLIPGGNIISAVASTKWSFYGLVNATGIGSDIVADPCWQKYYYVDKSQRVEFSQITDAEKAAWGCKCMGTSMFTQCKYPGIQDPEFYSEKSIAAIGQPKPVEPVKPTTIPTPSPLPTPTEYPSPTPYPTFTPLPQPSDPSKMQAYQTAMAKQGEDYKTLRENQFEDLKNKSKQQGEEIKAAREKQFEDYKNKSEAQGKQYEDAMKAYADQREAWQTSREKAIGGTENNIKAVVDAYGGAFSGNVFSYWLPMIIIIAVLFPLLIWLQKRKDSV